MHFRSDATKDEPQSVIHVPTTFKSFEEATSVKDSEGGSSDATVVSRNSPEAAAASPIDKVSFLEVLSLARWKLTKSTRSWPRYRQSTPMYRVSSIVPRLELRLGRSLKKNGSVRGGRPR